MQIAVQAADSKHGHAITVLNMQQVSLVADYFVIVDANSQRQVDAIVDAVVEAEENQGLTIKQIEGSKNSPWILLDLGDVIVHVFTQETREFYQLEKLWSQAPVVEIAPLLKK